jgi:hypothetical protein
VGVAGGLAGHDAKAETLARIIGGGLQAAVVEDEGLALGAFQKQLAVVGAGQGLAQDLAGAFGIDAGGVEQGGGEGRERSCAYR